MMLFRSASPSAALPPLRDPDGHGDWRLLSIYALAHAGAVLSYLPLLGLMLPVKVARLAGPARLDVLTAAVIWGAVAASLSNLAFGWLSDRSLRRGRNRRLGLAAGLLATIASYALIVAVDDARSVVAAVIVFQLAVNAMLAPLFALTADEIADRNMGRAGGLLTLGVPFASAISTLLVGLAGGAEGVTLAIVAAIVGCCMLPLLLSAPRPVRTGPRVAGAQVRQRRNLAAAWAARLLVQVAGNALFLYLLYYFATLAPDVSLAGLAPSIGSVQTLAFALPLPVALAVGIASDRLGRRKPFLLGSALVAAIGIGLMALASTWAQGVRGFTLYAVGTAVFLGLNAGLAMQLTTIPARRGRDLGFLNLANTLPALVGPALTWSLATPGDFGPALWTLAALTGAGGILNLLIEGERPARARSTGQSTAGLEAVPSTAGTVTPSELPT